VVEDMKAAGMRPNVVTFTTLVSGWVQKGDMKSAHQVVDDMKAAGVRPNEVTFTTLFRGCKAQSHAQWALSFCRDALSGLGRSSRPPSSRFFNTAMSACVHTGLLGQAKALFRMLVDCGYQPDRYTPRLLADELKGYVPDRSFWSTHRLNAAELLKGDISNLNPSPPLAACPWFLAGTCRFGNNCRSGAHSRQSEPRPAVERVKRQQKMANVVEPSGSESGSWRSAGPSGSSRAGGLHPKSTTPKNKPN